MPETIEQDVQYATLNEDVIKCHKYNDELRGEMYLYLLPAGDLHLSIAESKIFNHFLETINLKSELI